MRLRLDAPGLAMMRIWRQSELVPGQYGIASDGVSEPADIADKQSNCAEAGRNNVNRVEPPCDYGLFEIARHPIARVAVCCLERSAGNPLASCIVVRHDVEVGIYEADEPTTARQVRFIVRDHFPGGILWRIEHDLPTAEAEAA